MQKKLWCIGVSSLLMLVAHAQNIPWKYQGLFRQLQVENYPAVEKKLLLFQGDTSQWNTLATALYAFHRNQKPDSVYARLKQHLNTVPAPVPGKAKAYKKLGIHPDEIREYLSMLENAALLEAIKANTVAAFQTYLNQYAGSMNQQLAIEKRNALAFDQARAQGSSQAISKFLEQYPGAVEKEKALELYDDFIYHEMTHQQDWTAYQSFVTKYPESKHRAEALDSLDQKSWNALRKNASLQTMQQYLLVNPRGRFVAAAEDSMLSLIQQLNQPDSTAAFLQTYPKHRHVIAVWQLLYTQKVPCPDSTSISVFLNEHPSSPIQEQIQELLQLEKEQYQIVVREESYGFVNGKGDTIIPIQYEEAQLFHCGLALVAEPCDSSCYYFINRKGHKLNTQPYTAAYSFDQGMAVVATDWKDGEASRFGTIDRLGRFMIEPVYDYMEPGGDAPYLIAGKSESGLGFIYRDGRLLTDLVYDDILPFSEGKALVKKDSTWFYLNEKGKQAFSGRFMVAESYSDSLAAVSPDGIRYGYIRHDGSWAIAPKFDYASDFSGGKAVAGKKILDKRTGNFNMQRFEIDQTGKTIKILKPESTGTGKSRKRRGRR